jgi:hypothetical protein
VRVPTNQLFWEVGATALTEVHDFAGIPVSARTEIFRHTGVNVDTTPPAVSDLAEKQAEAIDVAGADYSATVRWMGVLSHSGPALVPPTQLGH